MRTRQRLDVTGVVQGVGFRPFVHRLAGDLQLGGFVRNELGRVRIEVEGPQSAVTLFRALLREQSPALAEIDTVVAEVMAPRGQASFRIEGSVDVSPDGELPVRMVPADVATCDDCIGELFDPTDRRYRHPFITCTNCGPRFTIITELPYDRPNTTMAGFELCPACAAEYHTPPTGGSTLNRWPVRAVGPRLRYEDDGGYVTTGSDTVIAAVQADVNAGRAVAIDRHDPSGSHVGLDRGDHRVGPGGDVARHRPRSAAGAHSPDRPAVERGTSGRPGRDTRRRRPGRARNPPSWCWVGRTGAR